MAMAASSLSSFGGQNVMLMRSDMGSSNSLVAMLTSCNPHIGFQVPRSGGGGLEDAIAGACGQKRQYYPTFDAGAPLDGEPEDDALDAGDDGLSHGGPVEKKRRLSFDQVRSLERNFEMENKLEPERKMQLAKELGLQPRQVAVWFQNRRARWKTKQLERDYEMLNSGYLKLKADFETALREKDVLKAEVQRLSGKTSSQDAQSVDSSQCESEAVTEPPSRCIDVCASAEKLEIMFSEEDVMVKEPPQTTTTTSSGSNNNSSSELVDAESPRTTDSNHNLHQQSRPSFLGEEEEDPSSQLASYCNQFPTTNVSAADSFVGPDEVDDDAIVALPGVKLEGFQVDPHCGYFLPPMVEQGVLPWWDWA